MLVGMMGTGKTTVGRKVAARLQRRFVDLDAELEHRSGRSVRAWFADEGEDAFRDAEQSLLADVLAAPEPLVVAAGGGAVCRAANRARLAGPDVAVVWLDATPSFLASRLRGSGSAQHRPLLDVDPLAALERLHDERGPWYAEVADVTVAADRAVHATGDESKVRLADAVLAELERRELVRTGAAS